MSAFSTHCGILYQFCLGSNYNDDVYEILKKVMKNCGLKAVTLPENTNEFSHGIFSNSKYYFVILTLINETFYQMTQSFNQMRPSSFSLSWKSEIKIFFTQFNFPGNISEYLRLNILRRNLQNITALMTCQNSRKQSTNHTKHPLKLVSHAKQHRMFWKFIAHMATGWIIRIMTEKTRS